MVLCHILCIADKTFLNIAAKLVSICFGNFHNPFSRVPFEFQELDAQYNRLAYKSKNYFGLTNWNDSVDCLSF